MSQNQSHQSCHKSELISTTTTTTVADENKEKAHTNGDGASLHNSFVEEGLAGMNPTIAVPAAPGASLHNSCVAEGLAGMNPTVAVGAAPAFAPAIVSPIAQPMPLFAASSTLSPECQEYRRRIERYGWPNCHFRKCICADVSFCMKTQMWWINNI